MNELTLVYEVTTSMCADMCSTYVTDRIRLAHACNMIPIIYPNTLQSLMVSIGLSHGPLLISCN